MLSRSISSTDAAPTPIATARGRISAASRSRCAADSVLESRTPAMRRLFGRTMTAAATTAPQVGATPTSSTPATRTAPARQSGRSKRKVGSCGTSPTRAALRLFVAARTWFDPVRRTGSSGGAIGRLAARSGVRPSLAEGRGLPDALAQEVQLGPAGHAMAHDVDLLDARAVDLERPLHADAAGDLADRNRATDPTSPETHDRPLEDLDALLAALDDASEDADGVTAGEDRKVGSEMVGDDLVEHVHGGVPWLCGQPKAAGEAWIGLAARGRGRSIARAPPDSATGRILRRIGPLRQTVQDGALLGAGLAALEEIGATRCGAPERGLESPAPHRRVVTAHEDVGHTSATKRRRPGVLRVLEEPVGEGFLGRRGIVDRTGQQPDHGIDHDQGRELAPGQDIVADRELEIDEIANPLVDALIAGTHEDEVLTKGQVRGTRLPERLARRIEEDGRRVRAPEGVERRRHRLRAQDHARSPPVRCVIDAAVAPQAPLAEVVDADVCQALLADAAGNARGQRPLEHVRKECQEVDSHVRSRPRGRRHRRWSAPRRWEKPWRSRRPASLLRRPSRGVASVAGGEGAGPWARRRAHCPGRGSH